MNAHQAIKSVLNSAHHVLNLYLSDLSDQDLMERPVENANHAAWQIGHLISAEHRFAQNIVAGKHPALPDGFLEKHSKATATSNNIKDFYTKDEYLKAYNEQRKASLDILDSLSESDLDKPAPESVQKMAKTLGDVFLLLANHEMMHAGQLVTLRRKLGKPVLM